MNEKKNLVYEWVRYDTMRRFMKSLVVTSVAMEMEMGGSV